MESIIIASLIWPILVCLPLLSAALSQSKRGWLYAELFSATALLLALMAWIALIPLNISFSLVNWLDITPLRATLLLLVSFIAYIVIRYARTNFTSDPDSARFLGWLTLTISAVMLTLVSNHLIIFWLAWVSISLSMHQLLVFYPSRYRAVLAAHKKFIFARLAELCLATAFVLLYSQHNTLLISEIIAYYPVDTLSWQEQSAAILLAIVALIKCAQLPLHGWLIQVVESPTPVSALLHAGIINLGGFLMLLFAPLFSQVVAAQWLMLIIAGLTASIASLIMITRISVKVRLAWSTTAQMGLMLVECALGLYELALLHLVAHSCYKANEFLRAGSAVNDSIQKNYTGNLKVKLSAWLAAIAVSLAIASALIYFLALTPPISPWALIIIATAVLLAVRFNESTPLAFVKGIIDAFILIALYIVFKSGAALLLPPIEHAYIWQADVLITSLFITVLVAFLYLQYQPLNRFSQTLFISLNAGLYLDEWSTRATLLIWPIRLPKNYSDTLVRS